MTSDDNIRAAFDQGVAANRSDKPIAANPHRPSESLRYDAWNAGWYDEEGPKYVVRA
jgi:hypothetical protein